MRIVAQIEPGNVAEIAFSLSFLLSIFPSEQGGLDGQYEFGSLYSIAVNGLFFAK